MEPFYLVGEPLRLGALPTELYAPAGQIELFRRVAAEIRDRGLTNMQRLLGEEYLAIVHCLWQMGIDSKLALAHPDQVDQRVYLTCAAFGCRAVEFGAAFTPAATGYPRDFCTMMGKTFLFSPHAVQKLKLSESHGWKMRISSFGEGGRVLVQGNTVVCCERVILNEGKSTPAHEELRVLEGEGIEVGTFPSPLNFRVATGSGTMSLFSSDHIDRVACLLQGKDGLLYLVVDPGIKTADWTRPANGKPWSVRNAEDTTKYLEASLYHHNIRVRSPATMKVPYALNLLQFPDGRVLMTGGDPHVKALVASIVGERNVFETPIPIRYYPVIMRAGIRCLVSEAPMPIFIKK